MLYIVNARIPTEKAHGLQIAKMAESFLSIGVAVDIFLPNRRNEIKESMVEYYELKSEPKLIYIKNYLGFLESVNKKTYFFLQRFFFNIKAVLFGMKSDADFIYSRELSICFLLSLFGKNVIFEDHEPRMSKQRLYAFFLKNIKKKTVVAAGLAELYESFGVDKRSYIIAPNGVDPREFNMVNRDSNIWQREFGFDAVDRVVLYTGHFYKWKGVYTLLDCANSISSFAKVVIIGGTELDRESIKKYIKANDINNVFIKGFVPHSSVVKYIKSADVLVLPNTAQEERSFKYTTPIKLFEYMRAEVPIAASRIKSFDFYLKDGFNALLFEPDNPEDMSKKIIRLLNDDLLAKKIAKAALGDSEQYTWEKRVKKILAFAV